MKEIVIGCDNAAVALKNEVKKVLDELNVKYEDVGVDSSDNNELYPNVARKVAEKIIESNYVKNGILLCGTGIGMAITANKFPGIYAAVCHDVYSAERAKLSNDANIMTMGARVIGPELAKSLVKTWLNLEFVPGRSSDKVAKIKEFETVNFK
jgi:ribose 5-phosphate isomerase B